MVWIRRHGVLLGICAAFLALACVNLPFLAGFVGDERTYRDAAWEIFSGGPVTNLEHPLLAKTLHGFFAAIFVMLNSDPMPGMRLASILAGIGAIAATYRICLRFGCRNRANLAVMFLVCNTLFLVHARLISPEMISLCLLMVALCYFLAGWIDHRRSDIGISGAFLGLSLSAKWIGIWLVPWAILRLAMGKEWKSCARFVLTLAAFYILGNAAYFMNHSMAELPAWQKWALGYHQIHAEISKFNGSPAWTWFLIPQHLYYARLMPDKISSEPVISAMNPIFLILVAPAIFLAAVRRNRRDPATRLILECSLVLYLPWLFVRRPTYFFYALTLLPTLAILEANLLMSLWKQARIPRLLAGALIGLALLFFAMFYPAAIGIRIPNSYEKILSRFNFYHRPVYDSMFCQKCNLFSGGQED